MRGRLRELFCVTEPHPSSDRWHVHMLVREAPPSPGGYRQLKEWAWRSVGCARVYPFNRRKGAVWYTMAYMLKRRRLGVRGEDWLWREVCDGGKEGAH